jgi:hypothetical protein
MMMRNVITPPQTIHPRDAICLHEFRPLFGALFGEEAMALNQPMVVHGDNDGSVRCVPLLISTPSTLRSRLLFELKVCAV